MKKCFAVLLGCLLLAGLTGFALAEEQTVSPVTINETTFPDAAFRAYIQENYDNDPQDGVLSPEELFQWEAMSIPSEAQSIQGVEYFRNLTGISWKGCPLETLDLSRFDYWSTIEIKDSKTLKTLISHQKYGGIYCYGCSALQKVELKDGTELDSLFLTRCGTSEIPLSACPSLKRLELEGSPVSSLDVSNCPALEVLGLARTRITAVDVTGNPMLEQMNLDDCPISSLDVRQNSALKNLSINNTRIESIDLSNCSLLERVDANGNALKVLDVTALSHLKELSLSENRLSSIDVSHNPELEYLDVQINRLTKLDVRNNPKLTFLQCGGQPLEAIDLSENPELRTLSIGLSGLQHLDVSKNPRLKELWCYETMIQEIDLSQNTELESIDLNGNMLSHVDLSSCGAALTRCELSGNCAMVSASGNQIALSKIPGFDASKVSNLQGGKIQDGNLIFEDETLSYLYDCGNGISEYFSMMQGSVNSDGIVYQIQPDGTAIIVGMPGSGDIVIPSVVDGYQVSTLGSNLFGFKSGVTSVTVPASVVQFGENPGSLLAYVFTNCPDLEAIYVDPDNPAFTAADGVLFSKDLSVLFCYPLGKSGEEYHVPESVTWMDCNAFAGLKGKREIYIENADTSWAQYTFANQEEMTVYYRPGGRTEERILRDISDENYIQGGYNPTYVTFGETEDRQSILETARELVAELITETMSDRQKALALHDWIITHAHYTMKYNDATGILLYGEGLCEAYAKAYQMLLDQAGLTNRLVTGTAGETPNDAINHMWNQVKIGNIWYHVDCTWDDPEDLNHPDSADPVSGLETHQYFLVSDQFLSKNHYWEGSQSAANGWKQESGGVVFLNEEGNRVQGWLQIDSGTFYFGADGFSVTGTKEIDGRRYTFEPWCVFTDGDGDHYAGRAVMQNLPPEGATRIRLPMQTVSVGKEAFEGTAAEVYELGGKTQSIESRAFANLQKQAFIIVPGTLTSIAEDAFENSRVVFVAYGDIAPAVSEYASRHGYEVVPGEPQ